MIAAIAAGRRAVAAIDAHLEALPRPAAAEPADAPGAAGATGPAGAQRAADTTGGTLQRFSPECLQLSERTLVHEVDLAPRTLSDEDAPTGLSPAQATAEARRCFDCGCVAATPSDLAPALVALDAVVVTTERQVPAGDFFAARVGTSTVLAPGELVTEVRVPAPPPGSRATYEKFRLRQAIDFPLVSVACALQLTDGVVSQARVVLGAAAPMPVRSSAAEVYLEGKMLDPATAREAGRLSVAACLPLGPNTYKVTVAAELVRRALLRLADARG